MAIFLSSLMLLFSELKKDFDEHIFECDPVSA